MYSWLRQLIGYTGSTTNTDQYFLYGSIALTLIVFVVFTDLLYRVLKSFIHKN